MHQKFKFRLINMAGIRGTIIAIWVFTAVSSMVQSQVSGTVTPCRKLFISLLNESKACM